ncbi:hypothetical protein [Sphingomonas sp. 1P08PE]|uniref:hypothetical protein n=1 Tax=Sphingomonas sp. 1P08PE TaxID=554122 RepID=UPI0039A1D86E
MLPDLLTCLRLLNVASWGAALIYVLPGASAAVFGPARRGDPMRLGCATTAIVMLGFVLRWLVMPDSEAAWAALYALGAADAVFIIALARSYGRGGHV